jgi:hypothetical protein
MTQNKVCEYRATTPEKRALYESSKHVMKRRDLLSQSLALGWTLLPFEALRINAAEPAVLIGRVTDKRTGETVPCSVRIEGSDGSVINENEGYQSGFRSNGEFRKQVLPGKATVTVSRGFDYAAVRRDLVLEAGKIQELDIKLSRRTPLRDHGWYCGDNHDHMIHGESRILVDFRYFALAGRAEGLDYLSVAQRWNLPDRTPEAIERECAKVTAKDFLLTWNMEMPKNYFRGDVTHCLGHGWCAGIRGRTRDGLDAIAELMAMNAGDYQREKTPTPNFDTHALIHDLGGIVSYTHPCRQSYGRWGGRGDYPIEEHKFISNLAQELPFDTIAGPTYDTLDILMQTREREVNRMGQQLWFMLLNKGYRIPGTASSDATFDNPGRALPGAVRVYTHLGEPFSMSALVHSMKAGRNFVTGGPLLLLNIDDLGPGSIIPVSSRRNGKLRVQAWASGHPGEYLTEVEIIRNGEVFKRFPLTTRNSEFATELPIEETDTAWFIARCRGSNENEIAITNPIYFEGPGYRAPAPEPAAVAVDVQDARTRAPLGGRYEVLEMTGRTPAVKSAGEIRDGKAQLQMPATARLRVQSQGYSPQIKSVFLDQPHILDATLNYHAEQLLDWNIYETIRTQLRDSRLSFALQPIL